MLNKVVTKIFGTRFDRERKKLWPVVEAIHREEARLKDLTEEQLKAQTPKFRAILAERTAEVKGKLDEVRAAKHSCPDPVERDKLESQYHELDQQYKKAAGGGPGGAASRGIRDGAGGGPPADRDHR